MKLSEFLETLEFQSPKKSSEYVGRKETNPVMILEENVPAWIRQTDLDDLQMSLKIFQDRVCLQGYPAIYSPQFWIANASLTAIYDVMKYVQFSVYGFTLSQTSPDFHVCLVQVF